MLAWNTNTLHACSYAHDWRIMLQQYNGIKSYADIWRKGAYSKRQTHCLIQYCLLLAAESHACYSTRPLNPVYRRSLIIELYTSRAKRDRAPKVRSVPPAAVSFWICHSFSHKEKLELMTERISRSAGLYVIL